MKHTGTFQGAAARKFAGFTYRKRLMQPIESIWSLDPERLNYMDPWPRSVNPPRQPVLKVVELADYSVEFSDMGTDGLSTATVRLLPNRYTAAKEPMVVYTCKVAYPLILRHQTVEVVLADAFRVGPGSTR